MGDAGRDEPSGGRVEQELERVAGLAAHAQTTSPIGHRDDRATFETPAEVGDSRASTHARELS